MGTITLENSVSISNEGETAHSDMNYDPMFIPQKTHARMESDMYNNFNRSIVYNSKKWRQSKCLFARDGYRNLGTFKQKNTIKQ